MSDASKPAAPAPDATERMAAMGRIAEKSRRVAELWLSEGAAKGGGLPVGPGLANDFMALSQYLKGTPIDLRKVETPVFLLSAREDHIAPWRNTYTAAGLYAGPVRFVLAGSGHIAGVINPAGSTKYGFCTNEALPPDPDAWLEGATQHPGSWWPTWAEWQAQFAGGKVKARVPGKGGLPALEDAPGSYVKVAS